MNQRSIQSDISLTGKGLHSGQEVTVKLCPAPVNVGVVFIRVDMPHRPEIKVGLSSLSQEQISRCSMIQEGDAKVFTLEHLMAALAGLGIDNIFVEINGEEVPGLDGSALPFVEAIQEVGVKEYEEPKQFVHVKERIEIEDKGATVSIEPADELTIAYHLDYPQPWLKQQVEFTMTEDVFVSEIAPSRTFCLKEEAEYLRSQGLGQGATPQNTLIVDENGPQENTFRFPDECARHKLLDCFGDVYLLGKPLKGRIKAHKSGHALNNQLVRKIVEQVGSTIQC